MLCSQILHFGRMWHRDSPHPLVFSHFKLNTSSLTPGKPKVNPEFSYRLKMGNFYMNYQGERIHYKQLIKEIYIYFQLPSNVARQDINTFVSFSFLFNELIWLMLFFILFATLFRCGATNHAKLNLKIKSLLNMYKIINFNIIGVHCVEQIQILTFLQVWKHFSYNRSSNKHSYILK